MSKNDIISARLDLIAAKARILAEQYRNNSMWDDDLNQGLSQIEKEISTIRDNGNAGISSNYRGWQGDR